jgi:hypothetical protein
MKHVGKMKNNGAKIAIAYRTLPGDPYSALVVGTSNLGDAYHDSLMTLIAEESTQNAWELAEVLAVRSFPDGNNMLTWLHSRNHLKKVATEGVIVTPTPQSSIPLSELNLLIAEQKGIQLEDLSVQEETSKKGSKKKDDVTRTTSVSVNEDGNGKTEINEVASIAEVVEEDLSPSQLRSKADKLFKEAQSLRKQADELDPPKKRTSKVSENA